MLKINNILVSIIIPIYNAEKYILETIASIEQQTYPNWELILVDDKSPDNSCSVIEEYISTSAYADRIRLIKKEYNEGAAKARNTGLEHASGRYVAFLDADDIWLPSKLEEQLLFMRQKDVAFSFTSYEYGDSKANETGRIVHVPARLDFKHALSRTVIFTSTVMFDTAKIDRRLIRMPDVPSEDSATWWLILKEGYVAYGMDRVLTVYRRPESSLSSNKGKAVGRVWNLYRNVVKINVFAAVWHLIGWAFQATFRRIWFKKIESHKEMKQRLLVLSFSLVELVGLISVYAYFWFEKYYPIISMPRISQDGYNFGAGLKLYSKGHILVILIYFFLLYTFMKTYRALELGEKKPVPLFFSQTFALGAVNLISYFQLSLMRNWLVPVSPIVGLYMFQLIISLISCILSYSVHRAAFPARELLLVSGSDDEEGLLSRFNTRTDQYYIVKYVSVNEGIERIKQLCLENASGVMFYNVPDRERNCLVRYCYMNSVRVYMFPDIQDVISNGTDKLHLFSTSVYLLKEQPLQIEQRFLKRMFDVIVSLLFIAFTSPAMVIAAFIVKMNGQESLIHRQVCCTINGKKFTLFKFRTTTDVYGDDGHKKLIPGGQILRKSKLDELPQLFNILKGDMSFIGPRPETPEVIEKYLNEIPEYKSRLKVKAGLIGYTQVYGRYNASPIERLKLDLTYIQNYSLWLDVQLFFLAIKFIFTPDSLDED